MSLVRRCLTIALSGLMAVASVPVSSTLAVGPAPAAQCVGAWEPVGLPQSLSGMEPQAVATLDGEPAWLAGLASAVASKRSPMLASWVNDAWQRVPGPFTAYGILNDVEATSPTNAWTVGSTGSYIRWPISARWNGGTWNAIAVPKPSGQLATFADMALIKGQQLWAVGSKLTNGRIKPLAMKHLSSGWSTHDPPVPTNSEAGLADVTRAPGGRIWAAGWKSDAEGQGRGWVISRKNGAWRTTELDVLPPGRAAVTDLSFRSAKDGWAAGFVETTEGYQPLLQRWNGSRWSNRAVPWAVGRSIILNAVEVATNGRVAVGGMEVGQLRSDVLATLTGSSWQVAGLSAGTVEISTMSDVARLSSGFVAAGAIDRQPITMFPCSTGATTTTPVEVPLSPSAGNGDAGHDHDESTDLEPSASDNVLGPTAVDVPGTVAIDRTDAAGLDMAIPTWSGTVADFNDDSFDDVFINLHWEFEPRLMLGSASGTFTQLAAEYALVDRHRCAAEDVDLSGSMDLFCVIGTNKGTTNTPNELLLDVSEAGGTWASEAFGVSDGFGRGRDVTFLDLNGDPYPDVYVANEPSRADAMWSSNRLYRNLNGQGFGPAPEWGLDHAVGFGISESADLDNDGDDDLLLRVTEPGDGQEPGARIYINQGGQFVDRTVQLGLAMPDAVDMEVADFDGDGRLDVAQLSAEMLRVKLAGDDTYEQVFELSVTQAIAMAVGDVDADGRPDIYVAQRGNGNSNHLMLVNRDDATGFVSMTIPQPGAGRADDVLAIDHDGNGRTDFVTLNGWSTNNGPVKLTAFYPAP